MSAGTILVGAAIHDITPPPGLAMSGFAARINPAIGAHDTLTARAMVVGDTALVTLDVIGIDQTSVGRIIEASGLPTGQVIVQATHTHGGPPTMPGRLWTPTDPEQLARIGTGAAKALRTAWAARRPARLSLAVAQNARIGRNRRHADGATDPNLMLLRADDAEGQPIALLANYACHPVVLAADNLRWTADYPHFLRSALEQAHPGAIALFSTGFAGDVNTGHSAAGSVTLAVNPDRSFARASAIGDELARDLLAAPLRPLTTTATAAASDITAKFSRRPAEADLNALRAEWLAELPGADPVRATLLRIWINWSNDQAQAPLDPLRLPVTVFNWGGLLLAALPGEIFAGAALDLRAALAPCPVMPVGFAGDNPGYIAPTTEFTFGGYEIDEAHRFYGQAATFAPGTSEALVQTATRLAKNLTNPGEAAAAGASSVS